MKKLGLALATTIILSSVFLALLPHPPSALAQYSWTDNINIYKDVSVVYTNIRKITNNETVTVDVKAYITYTERINLLEYYKLSANGTDFIVISQGVVTLSQGTYYGLGQGQTLCFTVEAKGASSLAVDDTVRVGVKVEFWSAEYVHNLAVTAVTPSKTVVGQGYSLSISVTVTNEGNFTESDINVTAYANNTAVQTLTIPSLAPRANTTLTFMWNTTGFAKDVYTISANATTVPDETDTTDNTLTNGEVTVACPGDLTGPFGVPDGTVDMRDISMVARGFGANLVTDPSSPKYGQYWHPTPCITCPHSPNCDLTGPTRGVPDGKIDMRDISLVARLFGTVC